MSQGIDSAEVLLRTNARSRNLYGQNRFKQYFFDLGLLGALSGLEPRKILEYHYGSYKGYIAENYVAQELRASGSKALLLARTNL